MVLTKLRRRIRHLENYTVREMLEPIRRLCENIEKSGDITVEVSGRENIPTDSGFIFYSNHQGTFDAVALGGAMDFLYSPVIKKELMSYPLIRQCFSCMDAITIDRENLRQSVQALLEVQRRIESGKAYLAYIAVIEELAKHCFTTSVMLSDHHSLGSFPISEFGTEEQKRKYLVPLLKGEKLGAFAVTEPSAGSDLGNQQTTAVDMATIGC